MALKQCVFIFCELLWGLWARKHPDIVGAEREDLQQEASPAAYESISDRRLCSCAVQREVFNSLGQVVTLLLTLVEHFKFFVENFGEKCFEFYSNFSPKNIFTEKLEMFNQCRLESGGDVQKKLNRSNPIWARSMQSENVTPL
ncbi:hypothetical protein DFH09DRAFT_1080543 [Mycena vulgaris]|nr:hypothetical protein DFH09DRAFT_1080543 [Mycena vulgaris]